MGRRDDRAQRWLRWHNNSQAKASGDGGATVQGQESPANSVAGDVSRASGSAGSAAEAGRDVEAVGGAASGLTSLAQDFKRDYVSTGPAGRVLLLESETCAPPEPAARIAFRDGEQPGVLEIISVDAEGKCVVHRVAGLALINLAFKAVDQIRRGAK